MSDREREAAAIRDTGRGPVTDDELAPLIARPPEPLGRVTLWATFAQRIALDLGFARADLAAAQEENARLRAALEDLIRREDPRRAAETYDEIAERFRQATGFYAPGKDVPIAAYGLDSEQDEERRREWRAFCNGWHEENFNQAAKALAARPGPEAKESK